MSHQMTGIPVESTLAAEIAHSMGGSQSGFAVTPTALRNRGEHSEN